MTIPQYISQLNKYYKTGMSSEHTYRGDLGALVETDRLMKEVDEVGVG